MKQDKIKPKLIVFFLVAALALLLRFYKVEQTFVFSGDEEHQLTIAANVAKNFHIEWVGVSAADTGFYMGPFWVYFSAIWLFLTKGNPTIVAYVAAAIGVVNTLAVIFVGKKLFGEKVAIVAGFLYATLPLLVYYDRKFWNPAPTAITCLFITYTVHRALQNPKWWIITGFLYGMVFHVHLSLVPLAIPIAYFAFKMRAKINIKVAALSVFMFLIAASPILAFDYFKKGTEIATPIRVSQMVTKDPARVNPTGHFIQLAKSLGRMWYLSPFTPAADEVLHACSLDYTNKDLHTPGVTTLTTRAPAIFSLLSLLFLGLYFFNPVTWKDNAKKLVALSLTSILTAYIFLPNTPLEYYLLGVFPLFLFTVGITYQSATRKLRLLLLIGILFISGLGIKTVLTQTTDFGLSNKIALIEKVTQTLNGGSFELKAEGLCHKYEGWRFLFKAYGQTPARSSSDITLGWLYKNEVSTKPTDYTVTVSETRVKGPVAKNWEGTISEGGFTAYVYKN